MIAAELKALRKAYWRSEFGETFRRGGYRWGYFGESLHGFVRQHFEIPFQTAMPPRVQKLADELETYIREQAAQKGARTKRRNALEKQPSRKPPTAAKGSRGYKKIPIDISAPHSLNIRAAKRNEVLSGPADNERLADNVSRWRGRFRKRTRHWDLEEITRTCLKRFTWIKPDEFNEKVVRVVKILRSRQSKKAGKTRKANRQRVLRDAEKSRQLDLF